MPAEHPRPTSQRRLLLGSDPGCELCLHDPSVSPEHATAWLDNAGCIWLEVLDARAELKLYRSGAWVMAERLSLCSGDRVQLGAIELPLAELAARLGPTAVLRSAPRPPAKWLEVSLRAAPERPRRNPLTGLLEETTTDASRPATEKT